MCGRTRCTLGAYDIPRACYQGQSVVRSVDMDRYRPSYNAPPGSSLPVVRKESDTCGEAVIVHCMKWGLVPSFTKKTEKPDHFKMFNARSESASEKASFRRLLPKNRCLVAVEGFYEWKKDGAKKQPYYICFKDNRPLVFAGLYDFWANSEGEVLATFTILTTSSSSRLQWLHDRMPVMFGDKGSADAWLSGTSKLESSCMRYEGSDLTWHPVTSAMGATSFNGPDCIKEISLKGQESNSIAKFFSKKTMVEATSPLPTKHEPCEREGKFENEEDDGGLRCNLHTEGTKVNPKRKHDPPSDYSVTSKIRMVVDGLEKPDGRSAGDKQPTLFSYYGKT